MHFCINPRKFFKGLKYQKLELGNITMLLFIVVLKCHDNRYQKEIFTILTLSTWYYHKYHDYHKLKCSITCTSVKFFHPIITVLVAVVVVGDIVIISIITLMIYCDMNFLYRPSLSKMLLITGLQNF